MSPAIKEMKPGVWVEIYFDFDIFMAVFLTLRGGGGGIIPQTNSQDATFF